MSDEKNTKITVNEGFSAPANRAVLNEAMADNCQGLVFSLNRMTLPAGGGTAFGIPSGLRLLPRQVHGREQPP